MTTTACCTPNGATRQLLFENGLRELKVALMYHTSTDPPFFYQHSNYDHFSFESDDAVLNRIRGLDFSMFVMSVTELCPAPASTDMLEHIGKDQGIVSKL